MASKMTKKDWFETLKKIVEASEYDNKDEAIAFIDREIGNLEKRHSSSGMTKTQKENVGIMELIKDALYEAAKPVTITELMASNAEIAKYSSQKISALVKLMKDKGEVIRTEDKKKAYFSLPDAE